MSDLLKIIQDGGLSPYGDPVDYILEDGANLHGENRDTDGIYTEFDPDKMLYVEFFPLYDGKFKLVGFYETIL